MADVGRTDFKKDIIDRKDSVIDMIRIATYINTIPAAIEMIEDAHEKGYETTVNIMAVSKVNDADLQAGLEMLAQSNVDVIYLVDSFGAFYPEQVERLTNRYMQIAQKYNKKIGIHAHNNQQLAFANTIEALSSFLRNPKYNKVAIMSFVEKHILPLKEEGVVWGFDIPYMLTGTLNAHPSTAIQFIKEKRKDYAMFYQELIDDAL